jgi:hypothetical protein
MRFDAVMETLAVCLSGRASALERHGGMGPALTLP